MKNRVTRSDSPNAPKDSFLFLFHTDSTDPGINTRRLKMSNQKIHYGVFFILLPLIFAFSMAYYNSAKSTIKPYQIFREKVRNQFSLYGRVTQPQLPANQVLLIKDKKTCIKNSCLVFKGLSDGKVILDLYLLKFDPDMPYSKSFTKKDIQNGIWLGDVLYQPVKIKKDSLHLKIMRIQESG